MFRYRVTAYFEEKATQAQVAQAVVVVAEDDRAALSAVKKEVAGDAVDGRIQAIRVTEKELISPGVKFRGDPYIPFQLPARNEPPRAGL